MEIGETQSDVCQNALVNGNGEESKHLQGNNNPTDICSSAAHNGAKDEDYIGVNVHQR